MTTGRERSIGLLGHLPGTDLATDGAEHGLAVVTQPWSDHIGMLDAAHVAEKFAASDCHAVCIGPDVPALLGLEVSRILDEQHPEIGVILVRTPTPELWQDAARAGVRDIISPTAPSAELIAALQAAAERAERLRAAQRAALGDVGPTGKVMVILSPKGGSGKTMLATNLAVALASAHVGPTALVDLDCVFGDVASVLGLVPEHTVGQLAALPSFDSTTLKVFLARHEQSGLYVLPGSGLPEEGDAVTDAIAGQILDMLTRDFPYVVVDTAAGLDERALAAIERATDIILLASMDVASVRNLGKEIDALDRLGLNGARRHFILNRADARVGLEVADVEAALGLRVEAALPSSRLVPLSMNQGRILVIDEPASPVAHQLLQFTQRFLDVDSPGRRLESRRGRLSLWRR
jgi:pilus assembly protein CpaE